MSQAVEIGQARYATAGSVPRTGTVPDTPPAGPPLAWDGRASDLFGIHIGNLILAVLTLGIYRFWGIVRVRRYVWSHLALFGDRLEYTGTGGELLRSFLLALAVMVPFVLGVMLLELLAGLDPLLLGLVKGGYFAVLLYLFGVARHGARRYMASRSAWRGIRFAVAGSPWRFGWVRLGWTVATVLTFGLARPWATAAEARWSVGRLHLGTQAFGFSGTGGQLLRPYLVSLLFVLLPAGLIAWALLAGGDLAGQLADPAGQKAGGAKPPGGPMEQEQMLRFAAAYVLPFLLGLLLVGPFALAAWFAYAAAVMRWRAAHATLGGARFGMPGVTGWNLARLRLGNWLILIVSFGLLYPVVVRRNAAYLAGRLTIDREPDLTEARQAATGLRSGEGLADLLDSGVGFGV